MNPHVQAGLLLTRRHFFSRGASGIGIAALASLLNQDLHAAEEGPSATRGLPGLPHFPPKAKRVIYLFQSGAQLAGRPSIGAWLSYGLGSENKDLPAFVVMISQGTGNPNDQPLYDRLWGSGFLPTKYQGVKFRSLGDPVLYLSNPPGFAADDRRWFIDDLGQLNRLRLQEFGD